MALERRNDAGNGVMTAQGKAGEKTLREPLKRKVKEKSMTGLRLRQDKKCWSANSRSSWKNGNFSGCGEESAAKGNTTDEDQLDC